MHIYFWTGQNCSYKHAMLKVLRQRIHRRGRSSTNRDGLPSILAETNNHVPKTTKDNNIITRVRQSRRFYLSYLLFLVLFLVSWKIYVFPESNFIAFGCIDISPLRILYGIILNGLGLQPGWWHCTNTSFYWNNLVLLQQKHHLYECTFDLCKPWSHGGESWIYQGVCHAQSYNYNKADTVAPLPVILKSMKIRWGSTLKQEIQASQVVATNSELQFYRHGWNFLLISKLQDYQQLTLYRKPELLLQAFKEYWNQLKHLHSNGILHLDMWLPNLLFHQNPNKFQVIDFSSARYTSEPNLLQEKLFSNEWHLPKFPLLACQLPDHKKSAYCINNHDVVGKLCLGFLDAYPLAVRILRNLDFDGGQNLDRPYYKPYQTFPPTLGELVDRHDHVMRHLQDTSDQFRNDPIIPWISSFIDPMQLNLTRICGDVNHSSS